MRAAVLTVLGSLALSAAAMPANAGPAITKPGAPTVSNVVQVSGGCGPYYYRDIYGYCQPYNYGYPATYAYPAWYGYPYWHDRHHHHHH
jgi:hypothetical protein